MRRVAGVGGTNAPSQNTESAVLVCKISFSRLIWVMRARLVSVLMPVFRESSGIVSDTNSFAMTVTGTANSQFGAPNAENTTLSW